MSLKENQSRTYFLKSDTIGLSHWQEGDLPLALSLWGQEEVSRFISKTGTFSNKEIKDRLSAEISNQSRYSVQYWPVFDLNSGGLTGCCGLRLCGLRPIPQSGVYEMGVHLKSEFWGRGIAYKAALLVMDYAFNKLEASTIYVGHNPYNVNSKKVIERLGFKYAGESFYPPTGLMHPTYVMEKADFAILHK